MSYSEAEKMVRTATSNEPWGASEDLHLKIADATYDLCDRAAGSVPTPHPNAWSR